MFYKGSYLMCISFADLFRFVILIGITRGLLRSYMYLKKHAHTVYDCLHL